MAALEEKIIGDFYKYRTDYDGYTVYFENTEHYTKKEVRRIFTKYGPVRKVAQSEVYLCSHCFVAFVNEEDARKCIQDMSTTGDIQLLTITRGRTRPPHLLDRHRGRPGNHQNSIPIGMKMTINEGKKVSQTVTGHNVPKIGAKIVKTVDKHVDKRCIGQVKPSETIARGNNKENVDFNDNFVVNSSQKSSEFVDFEGELRKNVIVILGEILKGLSLVIHKVTMVDSSGDMGKTFYVPLKSRVPWNILHSVRVEEVIGFPVVIANIHEICNVDFLMDLLDIYEPMLASKMKIISGIGVRYCWIYFRSFESAESVERIYDGGKICGNRLVVRRIGME